MKLNLIIPFIFLSLFSINISFALALTPDSTAVRTDNGKKFIIHKVEPKEGWMSIARRYDVNMEKLKQANPGVENLKIGQLVNVPVPAKSNIKFVDEVTKPVDNPVNVNEVNKPVPAENVEIPPVKEKYKTPVKHTVSSGETLFSISKKFNVKIDDIRAWNNMEDNNLQLGQEITVGYVFQYKNGTHSNEAINASETDFYASAGEVKKTRKELRKEKREAKSNEDQEFNSNENFEDAEINLAEIKTNETIKAEGNKMDKTVPLSSSPKSEAGKKAVTKSETGSASWIDDNDINPSKFYALHRTAPTGTIIKVTNRMNNKIVFVKVVGVLPDTGNNSNIAIKLSKAAASRLDVRDARFQAELNYTVYE